MSLVKKIVKNTHYKFWKWHSFALKRNAGLRELHQGETCIILGNGGSIRYFDFSRLGDIPTIGCSYSLLDKRTSKINMKYMVFTDPYEIMPIMYNRRTKSLQLRSRANIFKRQIEKFNDITFFSSITNYYAHVNRPKNLFYFNFCKTNRPCHDISGRFSYTEGALHIMIGVAKYLGFKKVYILGCDYLGDPLLGGHFYDYCKPIIREANPGYCNRIKELTDGLDVTFVSIDGITSPVFKSASFRDCFGGEELFVENTDIIDEPSLTLLRHGAGKKQVYINYPK